MEKRVAGIVEKKGIANTDEDEWAIQGKPFVCQFPSSIFQSEEHALALLFDSECQQLFSTCQGLVELLLLRDMNSSKRMMRLQVEADSSHCSALQECTRSPVHAKKRSPSDMRYKKQHGTQCDV